MSGWFGTSNRDTNTPLSGIAAGHAARRNMQKQRYNPMGRLTIDQMAQQNRTKSQAVIQTRGGDKQAYKGFNLESTFNAGLNKWTTKARKGIKSFNAIGRSKGQSVNSVKNKIDTSLGQEKKNMSMFTDASSESIREVTVPKTDPGEVARFNRAAAKAQAAKMFTPVTMPKDFSTGKYIVRAAYNSITKKYTVSVIEGTVVKEVATFTQNQGAATVIKYQQFKALATKKFIYESQKPQSVQKTNYNIDLQVVQAMPGLSGFFSGVMNMFGLGRMTIDQMAEQSTRTAPVSAEAARFAKRADSGIDQQRLTDGAAQAAVVKQKMLDNVRSRQNTRARTNTRALTPMQKFKQASNTSVLPVNQNRIANWNLDRMDNRIPVKKTYQDAILRDYSQAKPMFEVESRASVTNRYDGKDYSATASKRPEVSAKWSEMPAKSFKVITSRKDGTVVKESGSTKDYFRAVDMFQTEVSTIENTPDFYDQDAPLVPEVPTNNGNGGDITSNYQDPIIAQAAAKLAKQEAAAAAAAKVAQANEAARFKRMKEQEVATAAAAKAAADQAAADAAAAKDFLRQEAAQTAAKIEADKMLAAQQQASQAAAVEAQAKADALTFLQQEQAAATAEALAAQQDAAEKASATQFLQDDGWKQTGSENYNELVNAGEDTSSTYIAEEEPGAIYVPMNYQDNPYVVQQATADVTPVAPAATHSHLGLALVGLAGLAYIANRK